MMTSILLIDVQGLEARIGGGLAPAGLLAELTHTMHGMSRQIMVQRAYCSSRVSTYRRNAYRDAGYQIVETAGPDETLIMMTLDLADLSGGNAVYEEVILLGGTTDYTALARLAHENLMMISVLDHPTIPTSLEALADGLIDPDDLPHSEATSILDRGDIKREETPRRTPFLAPAPKSAVLAPVEETAIKAEAEAKADKAPETAAEQTEPKDGPAVPVEAATDDQPDAASEDTSSDAEGDTEAKERDAGDPWPDPKTGPILVAGGSIADAVGVATAMDDPDEAQIKEEAASVDQAASADLDEATDTLEAELAEDINAELSISAEDIGTDPDQSPDEVLIDLQIEDLVAEEFTGAAQSSDSEPSLPPLPDEAEQPRASEPKPQSATNQASGSDDTLDELFADLGADLSPDAPVEVAPTDPLDKLDIAPEDLLEDISPLEPVKLEPTPNTSDAPQSAAPATEEKGDNKASTKELSEEVDELLSRLMSDGPSGAPTENVKLDVVPER